MKQNRSDRTRRKPYRPSVQDRQENRPTFDRFPEYTLFPMDFFKLK
jgi:hypothetical protein